MTNATHEGQRFCWALIRNAEIFTGTVNELRKDFASECWKAFDSDPEFDYEAAAEEVYSKIEIAFNALKQNDKDIIDMFLTEKD